MKGWVLCTCLLEPSTGMGRCGAGFWWSTDTAIRRSCFVPGGWVWAAGVRSWEPGAAGAFLVGCAMTYLCFRGAKAPWERCRSCQERCLALFLGQIQCFWKFRWGHASLGNVYHCCWHYSPRDVVLDGLMVGVTHPSLAQASPSPAGTLTMSPACSSPAPHSRETQQAMAPTCSTPPAKLPALRSFFMYSLLKYHNASMDTFSTSTD